MEARRSPTFEDHVTERTPATPTAAPARQAACAVCGDRSAKGLPVGALQQIALCAEAHAAGRRDDRRCWPALLDGINFDAGSA